MTRVSLWHRRNEFRRICQRGSDGGIILEMSCGLEVDEKCHFTPYAHVNFDIFGPNSGSIANGYI